MTVGPVVMRTKQPRRQREFYSEAFDFTVVETDDGFLVESEDEILLVFVEAPDASPRPLEAAGLFHTAFILDSRLHLGEAVARLRDQGFELTGAADHVVSEAVYLDDPEGNGVELYRDRPRDEWRRTGDGGVAIDTKPLDLRSLLEEAGDTEGYAASVGHVHLEVTDLDASEEFYRGQGFERMSTMQKARFLARNNYHHHVGINTWGGRAEPVSEDSVGLVGLEVEDVEGVVYDPDGVKLAEDYRELI